jgi:hypothetical protein
VKMPKGLACLVVSLFFVHTARTAVIAVPNTITEDPATSGANAPINSAARTVQSYFDESQLTAMTQPVNITGMQFRIAANGGNVTGDWPPIPIIFSAYDVQLSRASAAVRAAGQLSTMTTPFSDNQDGKLTQVRSGPLTIPAHSFPNSQPAGQIRPFGLFISFTTPYSYEPGEELLLTIRHTGYGTGASQPFVGSIVSTTNVAFTVFNTGYTSTVPTTGGASPIVQFTFEPVPEPACLLPLVLSGLMPRRFRSGCHLDRACVTAPDTSA